MYEVRMYGLQGSDIICELVQADSFVYDREFLTLQKEEETVFMAPMSRVIFVRSTSNV